MRTFIRLALSEEGLPSSKRIAFFLLLFSYIYFAAVNLYTGKKLEDVMESHLFFALEASLGTVFGSNILNKLTEVKKVQSNNNASVGSPSPTPTVVNPEGTTSN